MLDVPAFRAAVRAALDKDGGVSVREVARRSAGRISTTTILNMLAGHIPYAEVIAEYALATGEDPDRLLALAGKPFRYEREPASRVRLPLAPVLRPVSAGV